MGLENEDCSFVELRQLEISEIYFGMELYVELLDCRHGGSPRLTRLIQK